MIDTIYLDTCAINRLTDDHVQPRVRDEAQAIERILDAVLLGKVEWNASSVVRVELEQNPDVIRRVDSLRVLSRANRIITPTVTTIARARFFSGTLASIDALHLAACEEVGADGLLTTDDRFIRQAARLYLPRPHVLNPVEWLQRRQPWLLQTHP